jgi:hypothetical protein
LQEFWLSPPEGLFVEDLLAVWLIANLVSFPKYNWLAAELNHKEYFGK